jgi:hypothetical protein
LSSSAGVSCPQRHIALNLSSAAVSTEDLEYPECLVQAAAVVSQSEEAADESSAPSSSAQRSCSSSSVHVFPVLSLSLHFVQRIEVALDSAVFERLAGEVVDAISLLSGVCFE